MRPQIAGFALLLVGLGLLCATPARAGLGSDAAQVLADVSALQGVAQSTPGQQYDIQEITAATGTRVREYQNRSGQVFAVSWSGPVVPDLKQLLGTHFEAYAKGLAALSRPGLRRSLRITSNDLVVESGGHMRAYSGRAYLPALIPSGVPLSELR